MSIKDQIRAEIERRMNELEADWSGTPAAGWAFSEVLSFLDTLPEQPVKGLEEEYKDYVENDPVYSKLVNRNAGLGIARHFAEWGMNQRPLPEDTTIFNKGVAEGRRLEKDDNISLIESRIAEILGDAQPAPILRTELMELIEKIKK